MVLFYLLIFDHDDIVLLKIKSDIFQFHVTQTTNSFK